MVSRVFVVTGSNKGIGKAIVKQLLKEKQEKIVYLTSRNEQAGHLAVKELESEGLSPKYHQLDVLNVKSIEKFKDHLVNCHGGLDVLINNAGIAFKGADSVPFPEQVTATLDCNFYGIIRVSNVLLPIMNNHGRVVNISSTVSEWTYKKLSEDLRVKLSQATLSAKDLEDIMQKFASSAQADTVLENGFTKSAYGMSKVGVSFLSQIQQKEVDSKFPDKNILVNFCCPGFVTTDLTGGRGRLTPDEGADTPVYLSLLPTDVNEPRGQYHKLQKVVTFPPKVDG